MSIEKDDAGRPENVDGDRAEIVDLLRQLHVHGTAKDDLTADELREVVCALRQAVRHETRSQETSITRPEHARRVFVDVYAHETLLQRRRLVLDVPVDCTNEELAAIGGNALDQLANDKEVYVQYENEDQEEFFVLCSATISSSV